MRKYFGHNSNGGLQYTCLLAEKIEWLKKYFDNNRNAGLQYNLIYHANVKIADVNEVNFLNNQKCKNS